MVVVGGSAIEILTDGAYTSGDLDLCHATATTLPIRQRQEVMGLLGATGGPRNWQVAGLFVNLLGVAESFARTPFRQVEGPYGRVLVMKPEDLFVERVLVSFYPQPDRNAQDCARKLAAVVLGGAVSMHGDEVRRIAELPEYRNLPECRSLVRAVANELRIPSPLDTHRRGDELCGLVTGPAPPARVGQSRRCGNHPPAEQLQRPEVTKTVQRRTRPAFHPT